MAVPELQYIPKEALIGHPTGLFRVRSGYSLLERVSWPWKYSKAPLKLLRSWVLFSISEALLSGEVH
uniref:Uncharacterized protein n=1 Tax=Solanum lycopersicum TaxID=4081 RepID=A0A3Q7GVK3_SOLLC